MKKALEDKKRTGWAKGANTRDAQGNVLANEEDIGKKMERLS